MNKWLKYKKQQVINFFRDGYKSYVSLLLFLLFFLMFESQITSLLEKIQATILEDACHLWFGVTIALISVVICVVQIVRFFKYNLCNSYRTICLIFGFLFIYIYYRFIDSTFTFWSFEALSYRFVYTDIVFLPIITFFICEIIRWPRYDDINQGIILSDEAIITKEDDIFGYQTLVDHLLSDMQMVDVSKQSYSVGIAGKWGVGKSSFLNLLEESVTKQKNIVVRFYPRSSNSKNQIQDDFLSEFSSKLYKYHGDIQRLLSKYTKALKLFDNNGIINKMSGSLDVLQVESEKQKINQAIKTIGKKVFVIIEDLDRLTGEELLEVFKLIDRNADFCNVFYLSAYDKSYVNEVLKKVLGHEVTQDYTDKYFSYEIPLPLQKEWKTFSFVADYLQQYASASNAAFREPLLNAWNKVGNTIIEQLGTIRHVKRFINLFLLRYPHVCADVNAGDFLLLTLVRYKNIGVYDALLNGKLVDRGGWLSGSRTTMYLQKNYEQTLQDLGGDNLKMIVETLFPKAKDSSYGDIGFGRIRRAQSFDLYFYDQYDNRVYNKDLVPLFEESDENQALDLLKHHMSNQNNWEIIEEYLRYRDSNWINSPLILRRYTLMTIYAYHLQNRYVYYYVSLARLLINNIRDKLIQNHAAKDESEYKSVIIDAISFMIPRCSFTLGSFFISLLNDFQEHADRADDYILTKDEYNDLAFHCLEQYAQSNDWEPLNMLYLAFIVPLDSNKIWPRSIEFVFQHIQQNVQKYAKAMVVCNVFENENPKKLVLSFGDVFKWKVVFGDWDKEFLLWVKKVKNNDLANLLRTLYEADKNNEKVIVKALKDNYDKDDYQGFIKAIEAQKEEDINKEIDYIINKTLSHQDGLTFSEIIDITSRDLNESVPASQIKKRLNELVKRGYVAKSGELYQYKEI